MHKFIVKYLWRPLGWVLLKLWTVFWVSAVVIGLFFALSGRLPELKERIINLSLSDLPRAPVEGSVQVMSSATDLHSMTASLNALVTANNQLAGKVAALSEDNTKLRQEMAKLPELTAKQLGAAFVNGIEVITPDGTLIFYMTDHRDADQTVGWHWQRKGEE